MHTVETEVLIIGSGPAGASAALALSTYGVPNIVATRYARLAETPARTSPTSARWRCSATSASSRK